MASAPAEASGKLRCVVVTPERTVVDQEAEFVALPLYDGELGVAPLRQPLVGRLGYGELRIRSQGRTQRFYVDGGFVEVAQDVVSVLTARAIPAQELEAEVIGQQLRAAYERKAHDPEQLEQKHLALRRLQAQLRVARRQGQ